MTGGTTSERIVVKFAAGHEALLSGGEFISPGGEPYRALNEWLRHHQPSKVYPLFGLSSAAGPERSATERDLGLDRFYCVVLEADVDEAETALRELTDMPFVEEAYIEVRTEPAGD
jgi:hypothetical protein